MGNRRKVTILGIFSKLPTPASTFWTTTSKLYGVMRQISTFWNHNKKYFHMLKVEQNQRTFILPPSLMNRDVTKSQNVGSVCAKILSVDPALSVEIDYNISEYLWHCHLREAPTYHNIPFQKIVK